MLKIVRGDPYDFGLPLIVGFFLRASAHFFLRKSVRDRRSSSSYVDPAPFRVVSVSNEGVGVDCLLTFFFFNDLTFQKTKRAQRFF